MFATYAFTKRAVEVLTLEDKGFAKIAFGDSDVPASRDQTDLQGANKITYPITIYRLEDSIYFSFNFPEDIPFEVKEMGLFNSANEMMFRGTFKKPFKIENISRYPQRFVLRLKLP